MLYFLVSMLVMLALLDRALRIERLETLRLETRFSLFKVRDELRLATIEGKAPQNKWFEYLDTSITKAIDLLPHINAWEALALMFTYANDTSVLGAEMELHEALEQPENRELDKVYRNYIVCIARLLFKRHRSSARVLLYFARFVGKVSKIKDRMATIVSIAPETSTLLEHHS